MVAEPVRRCLLLLVAVLLFLPGYLSSQPPSNAAQLTVASGVVLLQRQGDSKAVQVTINTPLDPGSELSTAAASYATVQFPDGMTVRLSELSQVEFTSSSGNPSSHAPEEIVLKRGYATFQSSSLGQGVCHARVGLVTLTPQGNTLFQAQVAGVHAEVVVREGAVRAAGGSRSVTLRKNHAIRLYVFTSPSAVRVARLSYVSGTVAVKQPDSAQWQSVSVNTPLPQGFELATSRASYAEVEFQDGSTARCGELTQAKLEELGSGDFPATPNRLEIQLGYATFHVLPDSSGPFRIKIGDATLMAGGNSEFRTDIQDGRYRLEVLHGSVAVTAGALKAQPGEGKVLERQSGSTEAAFHVRTGIALDDWDKWVEARDEQAERTVKDQYLIDPHGAFYGWNDLNTYGEWVYLNGYSFGWMPYEPPGWRPYTQGRWEKYPGLGWTWTSTEPWGWLPYHCGKWQSDGMKGWIWVVPGSGCESWEPLAVDTTPPGGQPSAEAGGDASGQGVILPAPGAGMDLAAHRSTAPPTILMGGDAQKERALLSTRRLHAANEPLRDREGATLGGSFPVGGAPGEFRGEFFKGSAYARPPADRGAFHTYSGDSFSLPLGQMGTTVMAERPGSYNASLNFRPLTRPIYRRGRPSVVSHLRGTVQAPLYPDGWLCGPCTRRPPSGREPQGGEGMFLGP